MELFYKLFWLILSVGLAITEALTFQMITIWFAVGALAAFISSIFGAALWLQITIFVFVALATLILTRPLAKKLINEKKVPTNYDRLIGQTGIVRETIDNSDSVGQVFINGSLWSARSSDDTIIEKGNKVTVERIEGVKLIVSLI